MDLPTLAAYISGKPSTVRTLWRQGALPPPFRRGNIIRWHKRAVDLWLIRGMGTNEQPEQVTHDVLAERAKGIRKSMRRLHIVAKVSGDGRE